MIAITLDKTQSPPFKTLIQTLVHLDYTRVSMVIEVGEFAVRGDVIDVFPIFHTHPIRIEYDLNTIERLNTFFPHNQRSLSEISTVTIEPFKKEDHFHILSEGKTQVDSHIISPFFKGDYVVHETYGVGLFMGMEYKQFPSFKGEYICLQYKDSDKVYVPLEQLNVVHKYTQQDPSPTLNSLNNKRWNQQKKKVEEDTAKLAEELFLTHKTRQQQEGFAFMEDTELQLIIESEFEHQLTKDQNQVLQEIKKDMESVKPMERIICGDVGFGKTELLIRATLKALENHKQVCVLVPTTILAEQHLKTFSKRLKNTPYMVECLSRFTPKEKQKKIISNLKKQRVDCVIGTHRLLSKDIAFHDLGLLIIDEEQRFGVKHKETLKKLKLNIDIISVSATPIPRTMYLAVSGAKDFSIINTPPVERKPILTQVSSFKESVVEGAINRELKRSGQIFYVYNNISDMQHKAKQIKALCPNCRIGIAHAKMNDTDIKYIMGEFQKGNFDCLLSTTIIENGIDLPRANTIIIDKVENYGLSQIHQLRGRVGRSSLQGYAHLLYSHHEKLTSKGAKRLQAIREYIALGSGHNIALRDLEIRGAGNILGKKQHGHIITVGFSYFCKLLHESVAKKKGLPPPQQWLNLETKHITIPDTVIPEPRERMALYKRFLQCASLDELEQLQEELEDRYGRLNSRLKKILSNIKIGLTKTY